RYSQSDDYGESRLLAVIQSLLPKRVVGSLVATRDTATGRRLVKGGFVYLKGMRVIGSSVDNLDFSTNQPSGAIDNRFDRQVRAFGEIRQRFLASLKVG